MKKIISLLITIGLCLSLLVGCNLFTINTSKYYNQIVATAGDYVFYMEDLIEAYNLYGSNYTDNGSTYEEAVKSSLDDMIEKKLLIEYIKDNNLVTLTAEDYNDIKTSVYKSIQSSIDKYADNIKTERGIATDDEDTEDEATDDTTKFADYENKFVVDEDKLNTEHVFDIKRVVTTDSNYGATPSENFVQKIDLAYPDISTEAMTRYVKALQASARKYNRDDSESAVKQYEYDRLSRLLTENKYITKLQDQYENDLDIRKDLVVQAYKAQYLSDYVTYNRNLSLYNSTMSENASSYSGDIYYNPEVNYMMVTHILLKYDEVTSAKIALLEDRLNDNDSNYTIEDYNSDVLKLSETMTVTYTENGVTKYTTASQVFNRVSNDISNATTLVEKAEAFKELMYLFNEDTGIYSSDSGAYLVPIDTTHAGASDSMITEFADNSRELNEENSDGGNISSELVLGEYGYHIIFNLGEVKNLFTLEQIQNADNEETFDMIWQTLYNTKVQLYFNESLFEKIYDDSVSEDDLFNSYISNINQVTEAGLTIKKYESRYKSLWS